jgi:Transglycosylase-like domain
VIRVTVHRLLIERKHRALLGVVAALAAPAAASAAPDEELPPRTRLRAEAPRVVTVADPTAGAVAAPNGSTAGSGSTPGAEGSSIGLGNAKALTGPLLDPVDRYSELIVRRTVKAERVHKVHAQKRREAREEQEKFENLPGGVTIATLESIAACESGGDPEAVSSDGTYRGKYQFDQGTWGSVGGSGDPAAAPEAEQDYRAALLYSEAGSSPWPICGQ